MELENTLDSGIKNKTGAKFALSFLILFLLYHLAEYMIVFRNDALLFFLFQLLFFVTAFFLGNWYNGKGLAAWGLGRPIRLKFLIAGLCLGVLIYAFPYFFSLILGWEEFETIPGIGDILQASLPFAFGVLFSSFSEDVLTRGLIYAQFEGKLTNILLVLLSALIYLLNHIYRLADGPESWLYLFLLGVIFIIPLIFTRSLWLTGMMHWAGNVFFFVSHNVIITRSMSELISPNYLFAISLLLFIPLVWRISQKLTKKEMTRSE